VESISADTRTPPALISALSARVDLIFLKTLTLFLVAMILLGLAKGPETARDALRSQCVPIG
jgi:hypothetical protein